MIWVCFGHILGTAWGLFGHVLGMFWECSVHVLGMFRVCFGHVLANVLGMFLHRAKTVYFQDNKHPITTPQDRLKIEIVDSEGELQDISALATFDIAGCVSNKLLTI